MRLNWHAAKSLKTLPNWRHISLSIGDTFHFVVGLLRELSLQGVHSDAETIDLQHLNALLVVFSDILSELQQLILRLSLTPATAVENSCAIDRNPGEVG